MDEDRDREAREIRTRIRLLERLVNNSPPLSDRRARLDQDLHDARRELELFLRQGPKEGRG